jgi:hypothetical protein
LAIQELSVPAGSGSREPDLFVAGDGQLYMSWLEPLDEDETRFALRVATLEQAGWAQARTIAEGDNWVVNWADAPSIAAFADGSLAASWRVKNGGSTYFSYDIHVAHSHDGGASWSSPIVPHADGTKTMHGLVSMLPWSDDSLLLAWLDAREMTIIPGEGYGSGTLSGEMTLRMATIDTRDRISQQRLLDARICSCCRTAAALTADGAVIAYRDRSEQEVRDISIVRFDNGRWSEPRAVHEDGWEIDGCPINGPAIAADGRSLVVAWFTAARDDPRVQAVFSNDGGKTFGQPIRVAGNGTLGRVDIVLLADRAALVVWLQATADGEEIWLRRVPAVGPPGPTFTLLRSGAARTIGFPRIERTGDKVYLAWTQRSYPPSIRTAVVSITALQ